MQLNDSGGGGKTPSSYVMNQFKSASKSTPTTTKGAGLSAFRNIYSSLNKASNAQAFKKSTPKPAAKSAPQSIVKSAGALATLAKYSQAAPKQTTAYAKMKAITHAAATTVHKPVIAAPTHVVASHPAVVSHPVAHPITSAPAHQVSIAALSGDKTAQSYLHAVHSASSAPSHTVVPTKPIISPVPSGSGSGGGGGGSHPVTPTTPSAPAAPPVDWSKYTPEQLNADYNLRQKYVAANPFSDYTKGYDMHNYNTMTDWVKNNKQISNDQLGSYQKLINKWNLKDYTDPYNQMGDQNQANQKNALNAQDVALNTGMGQMDANSFQQFQQLQQQMNDRGMGDSGITQDAYMRAQMGNNQNYQQAFSDAATKKADITNQYTQQGNDIVGKDLAYKADRADANAKNAQAQQQAQIDLLKQQTVQDQYLTTSTGMVYMNGKALTSNGKPITSVEYQKLSETQRHNIALENNTATKNAQDYTIGLDKNAIARQKVSSDLQQALAKNKLEYSKLDYNYAKLDSTNSYNQDKIRIAADNAQSTSDRNQLNALGRQSSDLTSQITAYQKKGNKPPKSLVDKYNQTNDAISKIVSGTSFKNSGGGGGTTSAGQSAFAKNFASSGVNQSWYPLMSEIVRKESSYNPKAKNPHSTAYGYGQFLSDTRRNYEKKLGLNYDNPVDQISMMAEYIKDRYGTPEKANAFWNANHWY